MQDKSRSGASKTRIRHVVSVLDSHGSPHRIIEAQSPEAEAIADWIESRFPVVGVQIDWARVSSARCVEWSDTDGLIRGLATLVRDLPPETTVAVTWSDALYPSVEMPLSEVLKAAPAIFECAFDTWIVCETENWCIEVHHEGTICFGHGRPSFELLGVKNPQR
jgi:hypothetical protein